MTLRTSLVVGLIAFSIFAILYTFTSLYSSSLAEQLSRSYLIIPGSGKTLTFNVTPGDTVVVKGFSNASFSLVVSPYSSPGLNYTTSNYQSPLKGNFTETLHPRSNYLMISAENNLILNGTAAITLQIYVYNTWFSGIGYGAAWFAFIVGALSSSIYVADRIERRRAKRARKRRISVRRR